MKWCLSMVFTISRPCAQALGVPCLTGKCWTSCLTLHPVGIRSRCGAACGPPSLRKRSWPSPLVSSYQCHSHDGPPGGPRELEAVTMRLELMTSGWAANAAKSEVPVRPVLGVEVFELDSLRARFGIGRTNRGVIAFRTWEHVLGPRRKGKLRGPESAR